LLAQQFIDHQTDLAPSGFDDHRKTVIVIFLVGAFATRCDRR
jgi:hypothetical protein